MRILLLAPQPFFRVRGTPINIRNVLRALSDAGHEVDLLCYPFGDEVVLPGLRTIRSPGFPGIRDVKVGPSPAKFPLDGLMALRLCVLLCRKRYDVIHAVEEAAFFGGALGRLFRVPFVMDMDSVISDQLAYSGFVSHQWVLDGVERLERRAMRRALRVLTVCQSLSDAAKRICPDARIVQVEDAPLEERFETDEPAATLLRKEFNIPEGPCVVYTGNFEAYQGVDVLITAWKEVVAAGTLVLVGGEPRHRLVLEQQAETLGLRDRIVFTGALPLDRMPACMTLADVLVSPRTKGTNTALKLYGYMQAGKAIVATDLETHTQVLDSSSAFLVPPTGAGLAAGLQEALSFPSDAAERGQRAAQRVDAEFGFRRFMQQIQGMYREIEGELRA